MEDPGSGDLQFYETLPQWLDEEIPALDGHTPRFAAHSVALRPQLVEMLKDLEHQYQMALKREEPGFDPSWKDQHPRWIRPFWKGPDIASVIERAYQMKP